MNVHDLVSKFQTEFADYALDMSESNHHYDDRNLNPYHLEGDVWTHTMMVLKEATNLDVSEGIEEELLLSALLHDVGKPLAREVIEGRKRVRFIGHEGISFHLAVGILEKFIDDPNRRRRILEAIAFHDFIFKSIKSDNFSKKYGTKFAYNRETARLALYLSIADGNGRFYAGEKEDMDGIFNTVYQEFIKLDRSMWSHANIIKDRNINDKTNQVHIMVGLPGSGKTTYIENCELSDSIVVVSRDKLVEDYAKMNGISYDEAWRSEETNFDAQVDEMIIKAIAEKKDVVIDKTHMSPSSRRRSLARFPKTYTRFAHVITEDFKTIFNRNENRNGKTIKMKTLVEMMKRFRPPMYDDFDIIEYPNL